MHLSPPFAHEFGCWLAEDDRSLPVSLAKTTSNRSICGKSAADIFINVIVAMRLEKLARVSLHNRGDDCNGNENKKSQIIVASRIYISVRFLNHRLLSV
jgi:hypothetical protein